MYSLKCPEHRIGVASFQGSWYHEISDEHHIKVGVCARHVVMVEYMAKSITTAPESRSKGIYQWKRGTHRILHISP